MEEDSSLLINWVDEDLNIYNFKAYSRSDFQLKSMSRNDLGKRILNQVAISRPKGIARKEFLETLAGNFLIVDNENNRVSGSSENVFGYLGDSILAINTPPIKLEEPTDNGETYEVQSWFSFNKSTLIAIIQGYTKFYNLLIKAGIMDTKLYELDFVNEGNFYTAFLPTNEAVNNARYDTLNKIELRTALLSHFVPDHLIFTDGNKSSGEYETVSPVSSSSNVFRSFNIQTGTDYIEIYNSRNELITHIEEADNTTNKTGISNTGGNDDYWEFITTTVVHQIDTVLYSAAQN